LALTPEKEAAYVELLKTEYLLLAGAACAACETGDTSGLFEVLKLLPGLQHMEPFKRHIAVIEKQHAADRAKLAELRNHRPARKAAGPSPWGL